MSTDLTRPLVPSMGQHDPLDGFVTCNELQTHCDKRFRTAVTRRPGSMIVLIWQISAGG